MKWSRTLSVVAQASHGESRHPDRDEVSLATSQTGIWITRDANTVMNLARATYISQKSNATKGELYAWSKGLSLSEWQAFGDHSQ
ncbi:hypothetical protein PQX77_013382 [Marasmius sp. AFHP31]|nr:hypothetical protein PQX77_013382 [Marasmius sp. AFHP31]